MDRASQGRTFSVVPRKPRIENPDGIYHVSSRGNRGCIVYHDDVERRVFLTLLSSVVRQFSWMCHAYVLMSNHFHLLVQLEAGGLSAGMQLLNGSFARFSNRRHDYVGQHLFRNRFWSEEIVTEKHLLETARYIVLNPVRARICGSPADWAWSSYRASAGLDFVPSFLAATQHLRLFGTRPSEARQAYRAFVSEGIEVPRP